MAYTHHRPPSVSQAQNTTLPFLYEYKKGVFLATYSFLFSSVIQFTIQHFPQSYSIKTTQRLATVALLL